MELVATRNGTRRLQEHEWRCLRTSRRLHDGFVLGCIFIGLKQDLVELCFDRLWTHFGDKLIRPNIDLRQHLFLFFNRGQGQGQRCCVGLFKASFSTATPKVMRGSV